MSRIFTVKLLDLKFNYRKETIYLKQNKGAHNVSRKETSGGPNLSRFYEKNKFAKIEGGPMCRCLIWGPNLNLLYGMSGTSFRAEGFVPE